MREIAIDLPDAGTMRLWRAVADLVDRLPHDWVLIGGLMVQLHALEHGATDVRLTGDIDVLGQARPQGVLSSIDAALRRDGFVLAGPDRDGYAFRYARDALIVDVLSPDGSASPPDLGGGHKAIGVPGGSQALSRSETVSVTIGERSFHLRRPTLLGALLIKARSLTVHSDPESQRDDLLRLLALVEDPRAMAAELKPSERRWLRAAQEPLDLAGFTGIDEATVRRAGLAFRLLVREDL